MIDCKYGLRQWLITLNIWFGLWFLGIGLACLGYRRMVILLCRISPNPKQVGFNHRSRSLAIYIDRAVGWWPTPPSRCLHKSLLLWWVLRYLGIRSEVCTGVAHKADGGIDLHAWVEQGGRIANDSEERVAQYRVLWNNLKPDQIRVGNWQ